MCTRHAYQLSALALSKLQHDAFLLSGEDSKESWRKNAIAKSPTFAYWDTILWLELLGLIFVRAHRQKKFSLYIQTLKAITPWFLALDHQNYARWIPITYVTWRAFHQLLFMSLRIMALGHSKNTTSLFCHAYRSST
uniref:Uncharacterized protein n=1 Tax=Amphimedon queenslandica TaxID=400682 RepID=A0A1X7TMA1_AMPQE